MITLQATRTTDIYYKLRGIDNVSVIVQNEFSKLKDFNFSELVVVPQIVSVNTWDIWSKREKLNHKMLKYIICFCIRVLPAIHLSLILEFFKFYDKCLANSSETWLYY